MCVLKGSDTMTLGWRHLYYISSFINSLSTHEVGGSSVISVSVLVRNHISVSIAHIWCIIGIDDTYHGHSILYKCCQNRLANT